MRRDATRRDVKWRGAARRGAAGSLTAPLSGSRLVDTVAVVVVMVVVA